MFKLDRFSSLTLQSTKDSWLESAESFGIPSLDYERVLEWATSRVNYDSPLTGSLAYGIFDSDSSAAVAIVDIVYSKQNNADLGWLKMLTISLSPHFSPSEIEKDEQKLGQIVDIYTEALLGTVNLTEVHRARVVKLYGRDHTLLQLCVAVNERLKGTPNKNFSSKIEGRWLVISVN